MCLLSESEAVVDAVYSVSKIELGCNTMYLVSCGAEAERMQKYKWKKTKEVAKWYARLEREIPRSCGNNRPVQILRLIKQTQSNKVPKSESKIETDQKESYIRK